MHHLIVAHEVTNLGYKTPTARSSSNDVRDLETNGADLTV
jgi:hypothetical protein